MYDLDNYWRVVGGNYTTIPQFFKDNGYISIGAGKIYHSGQSNGNNDNDSDGGGVTDGLEVLTLATNPLDASDDRTLATHRRDAGTALSDPH